VTPQPDALLTSTSRPQWTARPCAAIVHWKGGRPNEPLFPSVVVDTTLGRCQRGLYLCP